MRVKIFSAIVFTATVFIFTALASSAAAQTVSVSGSIGNGAIKRGGSVRGVIALSIPGGLHINSNRPGTEFAIPTTVRVSGAGLKLGAVVYPRGRSKSFSFSDARINIYEGRVLITFNVTVPAGFKGSTARVNARVRYQACTDEVCYAPRNSDVTLTARVN
jgi:DsbC/DsbD-like thiol-disulfide interchange protein